MALSCRDTAITEAHQVQLFIAGLGKPLRADIVLQRPTTLDDAVMFARAFEQRDLAIRTTPTPSVGTTRTMQLVVNIKGTQINALLDSGSTHNFIDINAADRIGLAFTP
ncbi:hypothetical protein GUJ93_ZPchr0011g27170 [Zizania palustris]|uniref:Uncharacterized protein n=1 Tax=Zizania palustris TaxID=103762 RepID=A0A8J6BSA7_ZIZPA|nr:hypothetical protein GUJ93_ZPchr0011g27170 [Zizania palustris]